MMLTIWCFVICFGSEAEATRPPILTNDLYCKNYVQVVRTPEEIGLAMKLPRSMRQRLQGNELEYHCRCRKLMATECKKWTTK